MMHYILDENIKGNCITFGENLKYPFKLSWQHLILINGELMAYNISLLKFKLPALFSPFLRLYYDNYIVLCVCSKMLESTYLNFLSGAPIQCGYKLHYCWKSSFDLPFIEFIFLTSFQNKSLDLSPYKKRASPFDTLEPIYRDRLNFF